MLAHCPAAELKPSVTVEGMKRLLCQVFSKYGPILNLSHQQYVIAAARHFKPCGPSLTPHSQPLQYGSKHDPFFMCDTLGERLCLDCRCTVWALFALAGIAALGRFCILSAHWLTYVWANNVGPLCKLSCVIRIPPQGQCRSSSCLKYATRQPPNMIY